MLDGPQDRRPGSNAVPDDPGAIGEMFGLAGFQKRRREKIYSPSRSGAWFLIVLGAVFEALTVLAYLSGDIVLGVILTLVFADIPLVIGIRSLIRSKLHHVARTYWFAEGTVQITDDGPQVIRWRDTHWVSVDIAIDDDADSATTQIGDVVVCDSGDNRMTIQGVAAFTATEQAHRWFGPIAIPRMVRAFENGTVIGFASVTLDQVGIKDSLTDLAVRWSEIHTVLIEGRVRFTIQRSRDDKGRQVFLGANPNAFFAWALVERAAQRWQFRVRYGNEKALPKRTEFGRPMDP